MSSDRLSAADIAEGRAKLAAATGGPWFAWDRGVGYMLALDPDGDVVLPEGGRTDLGRREDAELIVWARNHLPVLLDAAESLGAARILLALFVDDEPCKFDHHGSCQAHDFVLELGEECPNAMALRWLGKHPRGGSGE